MASPWRASPRRKGGPRLQVSRFIDGRRGVFGPPCKEQAASEGGLFWLDLPEQGIENWARVLSVEMCADLQCGPGHMVTGWFCHTSGQVYEVYVEGDPVPLGITGEHPVWSMDRGQWVSVADLRDGERLSGQDGHEVRVVSVRLRGGREPVYNIEVDGQHCYRVGQQGLLVHNASGPKADYAHHFPEPEEFRSCLNETNVKRYLAKVAAGSRILQIAAGTNVRPGALALDVGPKDGYTAVLVKTTESYDKMKWFDGVKFDRVIAVNALNSDIANTNYSWIFENARHVLPKGGRLEIIAGLPNHASLNYTRSQIEAILKLGFKLISKLEGETPGDAEIMRLDVETEDPTHGGAPGRPRVFTRAGTRFRDTAIVFMRE